MDILNIFFKMIFDFFQFLKFSGGHMTHAGRNDGNDPGLFIHN